VEIEDYERLTFKLVVPAALLGQSRTERKSAREHRRVRVRHPVICRQDRAEADQSARVTRGEIRDLSVGGAQLAVRSHLRVAHPIELTAAVDGQEFHAVAEVISAGAVSQKEPKTGYLRYGIRWQILGAEAADILARALTQAEVPTLHDDTKTSR
jgi:hypothetical protein